MAAQSAWVRPFADEMKARAKRAFSTRRVPPEAMHCLAGGAIRPRSGDVVLARIERLGHHRRIEQPNGRRSLLHVGDHVIVAYADRYATDQFESHVPFTLGPTSLVAGGGIASKVISKSGAVRSATRIVPVGLVADERGRPLNVAQFALPELPLPAHRARTIAVLGTSMNSGKTTTIRTMTHGFSTVGMRPGVTKVTGTGSGNDYWCMLDAGAHRMFDFTDAGLASTFRQPLPVLERAFAQLVAHLWAANSGIVFVEIADGIFQQETSRLLRSATFDALIDGVVLAASDAMGAAQGVQWMTDAGIDVLAVAGLMTRSPLAAREAEAATGLPVLDLEALESPAVMGPLLGVRPTVLSPPLDVPEAAWPIQLAGLEDSEWDDTAAEDTDRFVDSQLVRATS